jgi:hypothetical protein
MTLKNLYEGVKNENTKSISWYIGAYFAWALLMVIYIAIIQFGWNYMAAIFSLTKLTYSQTTIITIWLKLIQTIFSTKVSNERYK